jgi:hypothetical protein
MLTIPRNGMRVSILQLRNITSLSTDTDLVLLEDVSLPGGFCVWLTKVKGDRLSGRYIGANWNTEELEVQKVEIVKGDKLKFDILV